MVIVCSVIVGVRLIIADVASVVVAFVVVIGAVVVDICCYCWSQRMILVVKWTAAVWEVGNRLTNRNT